jgi:outer membrane protein assembly factor BamB
MDHSTRRLGTAAIAATLLAALAIPPALAGAPTTTAQYLPQRPTCGAHTAWTTFGGDNARTGVNPCETAVSAANVSGLHLLWKTATHGFSIAQPTYAPGLMIKGTPHDAVFVADEAGYVQALDLATGAVLWHRQFNHFVSDCSSVGGVSGAPYLDLASNTGYAVDGADVLYAINLSTGANKPGWAPITLADPVLEHVYGPLTVYHGRAYIATASYCDAGVYYGRVVAVDLAAHKVAATWLVVPRSTGAYGGGIWGPGGVSVDDANGAVYAATSNAFPSEHAGYAEQIVRLDRNLVVTAANYTPLTGGDVDYGATPLLFQARGCAPMLAAKNKSGLFVVYRRNAITAGPWQMLQVTAHGGEANGIAAYSPADRIMVLSNSADTKQYVHGMVAFSVTATCKLKLAWQQMVGINKKSTSPPTIANGVVYWGDGPGHTLRAFDLHTGQPLWNSAATTSRPIYAAPTIVDGRVLAVSEDHHVYAFGL